MRQFFAKAKRSGLSFLKGKGRTVQCYRGNGDSFAYRDGKIVTASASIGCRCIDVSGSYSVGVNVSAGRIYTCNGGVVAMPLYFFAVGVRGTYLGVSSIGPSADL